MVEECHVTGATTNSKTVGASSKGQSAALLVLSAMVESLWPILCGDTQNGPKCNRKQTPGS